MHHKYHRLQQCNQCQQNNYVLILTFQLFHCILLWMHLPVVCGRIHCCVSYAFDRESVFHLLSASTGARVSETRAICFSKIDFQKKQLLIDCQLGRGYDNEGFDDNTLLSQKKTLKTRNSKRYVPLPDFIMDELYLARARYEETLKNDPEFDENLDFVLFRDHGKAIARPYYYFKKLMKKCNIDCTKHVWHDLRHTYATLLDQNNMNMKVVSEILGHYSEEFTNEVYVIHKPEVIIYDTSEVMNSFIESLKLDSTERTIPVYDISFIQEYLF